MEEQERELIVEDLMDFSYVGQTKIKDSISYTLEYSTKKDIADPLEILSHYELNEKDTSKKV